MTTSPTGPAPNARSRRGGRAFWLLPAVTFLVGLALGALLLWATRPDSGNTAAEGTPASPTAAPSGAPPDVSPGQDVPGGTAAAPGATAIVVPASCLRLADDVRQATSLLDEAATAARAVDAARLADLVRQMGDARATLDREANACRAAATSGGVSVTTLPAAGT